MSAACALILKLCICRGTIVAELYTHPHISLNIAVFSFSPELEWDEADWEWNSHPPSSAGQPNDDSSQLSLATVPSNSTFTLYNIMQSWKQ